MKKILFVLFLILASTVSAQTVTEDPEFIKAYVGGTVSTSFTRPLIQASIMFNDECFITDKFSVSLMFSINYDNDTIGLDIAPQFGFGVKYKFINSLYGFVNLYPHTYVHGIGPHSYGDYMSLYLEFNGGVGYNYEFIKTHNLFIELSLAQEVSLICSPNETPRNATFPLITFGYKHNFFPGQ